MGKLAEIALLGLFWIVVIPFGALLRLLGFDPMGGRPSTAKTYWKRRRQAFPIQLTRQS